MNDSFVGEIKRFVGNFASSGYVRCLGQQIAVAQSENLFSPLGYTCSGRGRAFALQHFRGATRTWPAPIGSLSAHLWSKKMTAAMTAMTERTPTPATKEMFE